jgi:hypothetical protein
MGLIEQIRDKNFKYWDLKDADTLAERFDEIQSEDWTICFNDNKYNIYTRLYEVGDKMSTLTCGVLYKVLEKKINHRDEMVVQIKNDKGSKIWILTDRFAYNPELAQNNMRNENLDWILDGDDVELV